MPVLRREYQENPAEHFFRFIAGFDWLQILASVFLLGVGLIFIRSTGIQAGTRESLAFFPKQLQWIAIGTVFWLICSLIDYRKQEYKVLSLIFYLLSLFLLVLVLFVGVKVNGAVSWLNLRLFGMRLQPSELSKLAVVMLLAAMFSTRVFRVNRVACLFLSGITVAVPFVLIMLEPDFGSAIILIPILLGIVFVAGLKWRYILLAVGMAALLAGGFLANEAFGKPMLKEYQKARIRVFLDPESDLLGRGYNVYQAKLAVGSGGWTGKGIGQGTQNALGFLPQSVSNNDFIFSVIAEESGFLGCSLLLLAYLILFYSILRTAFLATDPFGRYLGVGVAAIFFPHCFINIGMCIGLMPVTGIPLPFISYGGSFLLMGMAALGLMQSVYRHR